jgi:2',3'-cyclic-nucleotide 2'-phosphodiesterase (5'-nucleotidase family)
MRLATGADLAVINSTGIRDDLPEGKLVVEDVFRILPFDDELVTLTVEGRDLLTAFAEIRRASCDRGSVSQGQLDGGTLRVGCGDEAPELAIDGHAVDPGRAYRVATVSFLTEAGRWFEPRAGTQVASSGVLRDAVLASLQALAPCADGGVSLPCVDSAAGAVADGRIEWH